MDKPEACTLPTSDVPLRVAEFTDLFASSLVSVDRRSALSLRLVLAGPAEATVRDLVRRESECCSFFSFGVSAGAEVVVDVGVPEAHVGVLDGVERLARGR